MAVVRDAYVTFLTSPPLPRLINPDPSVITVVLSRFILELAKLGSRASDVEQGDHGPKGVLTTEWTGYVSDIPSQWTLDDEYNGRGFDKDADGEFPARKFDRDASDIETFELKERYEAWSAGA